jgi:hypothetical protein
MIRLSSFLKRSDKNMRKSVVVLMLSLLIAATFTFVASAGSGIKIEAQNLKGDYLAGGIELEIGIPGLPLVAVVEALASWDLATSSVGNVQVGAGGRFFLNNASKGPFIEAKLRYMVDISNFDLEDISSLQFERLPIIIGAGYRTRILIGKIDISVNTIMGNSTVLPKLMFGVQVGF